MKDSHIRRNLISHQNGEHKHEFAQILIGWNGRMDCEFNSCSGRISSGIAALIPAESIHFFAGLEEYSELLVIDVALNSDYTRSLEEACNIQFSDTLFNKPEFISLHSSSFPLVEFAASQLKLKDEKNSAIINCQLVSLFMTHLTQMLVTDTPQVINNNRLVVKRLNQLIDEKLSHSISNKQIAAEMNLSESHFYCIFQQQFGMTPQQYVLNRRMQYARHLLLNSKKPITILASDAGFSDASSFCRAYKKQFNETPGNSRKAYKISPETSFNIK